MSFWAQLERLRDMAPTGDRDAIGALIGETARTCLTGDASLDRARLDLLGEMAKSLGLDFAPAKPPSVPLPVPPSVSLADPDPDVAGEKLAAITGHIRAGISLVTCCMNRTENLIKALQSWLACAEITEIVIVDWSSDQPVRAALTAAGIADARIRVVRVEDEPRWVLSYAFNVGFRVADCDRVLKADADIVLAPDFFARNTLEPGYFIAGNWRRAAQDQAYVNGFFYLYKADLAAIAGFNEYITTYGWDDDDIYERLERHGAVRRDVDSATIHHLPHSDAERTGAAGDRRNRPDRSALAELRRDTMHEIRANRVLAFLMPYWQAGRPVQPYRLPGGGQGRGDMTVRCLDRQVVRVPGPVRRDVAYYALRELASWRLGQRVLGLERDQLDRLLARPFAELSRIDVEVALVSSARTMGAETGGYLVVRIGPDGVVGNSARARAFDALSDLAQAHGLSPVLSGPFAQVPPETHEAALNWAFIADWQAVGPLGLIDVAALRALGARAPRQHFQINLDAAAIAALAAAPEPVSEPAPDTGSSPAPALSRGHTGGRLFVDAQHGLGNRLRAIGSGAAIAADAGRELVVVWQPDDHCDCRFGDLFDYGGAVIEESFAEQAQRDGALVYNYMEVEQGAEKDAEIDAGAPGDIYTRSAYVLNSAASNWQAENRFLRSLQPVEAVRDMVAGVRHPNDVSAHVRMAGGAEYDHLPYEAAENWTEQGHQQIAHWREQSHFSRFLTRLDTLVGAGRAGRIFLAADTPEAYREFAARFGDRLAVLERDVYDRSATQLRHGLADALLLGRAPLLLGSTWSSFSELALRLAPNEVKVEMSGADF